MSQKGRLFTVQILMEDESPGKALEKLLHLLNSPDVLDYKVLQGIELGLMIDQLVKTQGAAPAKHKASPAVPAKPKANNATTSSAAAPYENPFVANIRQYQQSGTLVRLSVLKGSGIKISMPCRLLNFDEPKSLLTVYHVDEKKVYTFSLTEIEEIEAHQ